MNTFTFSSMYLPVLNDIPFSSLTLFFYFFLSTLGSCTNEKDTTTRPKVKSGFTQLHETQTGIEFENRLTNNAVQNVLLYEYFHNGGGVAIGDINNDGKNDIYFTANMLPNALYLNKGNMTFENIAPQSGTAGKRGWTTGCTMADVNGDGWLDIYVCRSGDLEPDQRRNLLFINQRDGTFKEEAKSYGLDDSGYSTQAIFFDLEGDNDLDMFLLNHPIKANNAKAAASQFMYDPHSADRLYRNDEGKFTDISKRAGIEQNTIGYGLGVAASDFNGDGFTDLYVCNDYIEHDYFYLNTGNGTFKESHEHYLRHTSNFSMGVDAADMNNDLLPDLFVVDMVAEDNYRIKTNMSGMNPKKFNEAVSNGFHHQYMFNTLQVNAGEIGFSEIAKLSGISSTDWSWAPLWADFDLDGYKDLFISNGLRKEARNNDFVKFKKEKLKELEVSKDQGKILKEIFDQMPSVPIQNYVFKNQGDLTFQNVSDEWGFTEKTFSNGAAYADLDGDGDLDLVINHIDKKASIYRNESAGKTWLRIQLEGSGLNTFALGTKVLIETNEGVKQQQELYATRGYQSAVEPVLTFGFPATSTQLTITVYWPDGKVQQEQVSSLNKLQIVTYDSSAFINKKNASSPRDALFSKSELSISYQHQENDFDDYEREVLLPHKMSQFGPACAVGDVNSDGLDDIFFGAAVGFPSSVFIQQTEKSSFLEVELNTIETKSQEDVDAVFFDADNDGDNDLYVVTGGNEYAENSAEQQDKFFRNENGELILDRQAIPNIAKSGSCVVPIDWDKDGDLDLFIGSRQIPGEYPETPQSYFLQNEMGRFQLLNILPNDGFLGMVTDAKLIFSTADNLPDLVLVGEWMQPLILENTGENFKPAFIKNLEGEFGWWNAVAVLDLNEDGKQDFIAGNLGLNYKYKASTKEPFEVFLGDFDDNGRKDIVLGYYQSGDLFPLRGRECSSQQIPSIKEKFPNYDLFGKASLEDVYDPKLLASATHKIATNFSHVAFIRDGDKFKKIKLPNEAQVSSVNDILALPRKESNKVTLVLAGNLYEAEVETPRADASYGHLVTYKNDRFEVVPNSRSGFSFDGEIRHLRKLVIQRKDMLLVVPNEGIPQLYEL